MEDDEPKFTLINSCPFEGCSVKKDILDPSKMALHLKSKKPEGHNCFGNSIVHKWNAAGFGEYVEIDSKGNTRLTDKGAQMKHDFLLAEDPNYAQEIDGGLLPPKPVWMGPDGPITEDKPKEKGAKKRGRPPKKKAEDTDKKSKSKSKKEKDSMSEEAEKSEFATSVDDQTMKSNLIGECRELIHKLGKIHDDKYKFFQEKENLRNFIQRLGLKKLPKKELLEIERKFHDEIQPDIMKKIRMITGEDEDENSDFPSLGGKKNHKKEQHPDIPRYRTQLRTLQAKIMMFPDDYEQDRIILDGLIHDCFTKIREEPTGETVEEIKDIIEGEILPKIKIIDDKSAKQSVSFTPKVSSGDKSGDFLNQMMEQQMKEKQVQINQMRLERMLEDEEERAEERRNRRKEGRQGGMVTVHKPVINTETGEFATDENGQMVYETVTQPQGQTSGMDPMMMQLLLAKKEDPMTKLMITLVTKLMTEDKSKGDDDFIKFMMTQQAEDRKLLMALLTKQPDTSASDTHRQEMLMMQQRLDEQTRQNHEIQMAQMQQQLQSVYQMAGQDPVEKLLNMREKLQQTGMIESPQRSIEEKTIEQWGRTSEKLIEQLNGLETSLERLSTPVVNAMAENIKNDVGISQQQTFAPQQQQQLTPMDEAQKLRAYADMLGNLEELDEE